MKPYYCAEGVALYLGDCIEVMRALPEASVDAAVCDPPYALSFMGKAWDSHESVEHFERWCEAWAREALRVLKPGGHLAAFGGTRTHHRLVCGIEDAGFEIRDEADWMYGSGFPKSHDVSKAIDKLAGAEREVTRHALVPLRSGEVISFDQRSSYERERRDAPATEDAQRWQGWGTALKPAHEPICLARKPLQGTVAANVLRHGTGALNIDGTRIGTEARQNPPVGELTGIGSSRAAAVGDGRDVVGRWPANVILDEEAAALLDATVPPSVSSGGGMANGDKYGGGYAPVGQSAIGLGDRGGPSRFFYTAKASRSEREAGLEELPPALRTDGRPPEGRGADNPRLRVTERHNDHPTVKPIAVMRWLVRLVTPPGGVVLDPFLGSGTTGLAALDEGMRFIGIDMTERYVEIARYRVTHRHVLETKTREADAVLPQGRLL